MAGLGGRRTHRTEQNRERVLMLLRAGNTREQTARFVGMDPDTLRRWTRADAGFSRACEEAESAAMVRLTTVVYNAAFGAPAQYDDAGRVIRAEVPANADLAFRVLERRDPAAWGRRMTVDVSATVRRYAEAEGFDPDEVMAEIEAILADAGPTLRGS